MPIYEYQCQSCEHNLEVIQKISDAPLTYCSECEQDTLKKKVSAAAFRLNGSGWYETDFKKNNQRNLGSSDSKEKTNKSNSQPTTKSAEKSNTTTEKSSSTSTSNSKDSSAN